MKTTKMLTIFISAFVVLLWPADVSKAEPMGTAWTYQGRLLDANGPPDGLYDFRFKLFDDSNTVTGNQLGSAVDINGLDVINGYFTVELDFGSNVFDGDARWLEIDVRQTDSNDSNDFITLNPRQEVTPTPYALQTRGIFVDDNGNVSIGGTDPWYALDVYRAVSDSWIAGFHNLGTGDMDGGVIVRALGGDPLLVQSATANVLNLKQNGNIGIGTVNPDKLLTLEKLGHGNSAPQLKIKGYYPGSSGGSYLVLGKSRGSSVGENLPTQDNDPLGLIDTLGINTSNNESTATRVIFRQDGDAGSTDLPGRIEFYTSDGSSGASERMRIDKEGKVGIGTTSPTRDLHIYRDVGPAQVGIVTADTSTKAQIIFGDGTGNQWTISSDNTDENKLHFRSGHASGTPRVTLQQDGKVGIGTTNPQADMDVRHIPGSHRIMKATASDGTELFYVAEHAFGNGYLGVMDGTGASKVFITANGNTYFNGGKVGIGTDTPQSKLEVAGWTRTEALEITGGSDLAEHFEISDEIPIEPGMVVSIDPEQPGRLMVSNTAYDHKVAGIVSGAGGIKVGMVMGQKDSEAYGSELIALTGRVYCWADASDTSIEPGDLLTTSNVPGHAMKVNDYSKAQGAILGKAMSSLEEGRGLVLVLVTLQ